MSYATLHSAIQERFKVEVAAAHSVEARYENEPASRPLGEAWVHVGIRVDDRAQIDFGSPLNRVRTSGGIVLSIHAPLDQGTKRALEILGFIASAFENKSAGGVSYRSPSILSKTVVDGVYRMQINIPFDFDEFTS